MSGDEAKWWPLYCGVCDAWIAREDTWTERGSHVISARHYPDRDGASGVAAPGGVLQRCMKCETLTLDALGMVLIQYDLSEDDVARWVEQGLDQGQIRAIAKRIQQWEESQR